MSPHPYFDEFEKPLDLHTYNLRKHTISCLDLYEAGGWVHLAKFAPSTPAANIPDWRICICGAWMIKVGNKVITSIEKATAAIKSLVESGCTNVVLLFDHPEIRPNMSHNDLPIASTESFFKYTRTLEQQVGIYHSCQVSLL